MIDLDIIVDKLLDMEPDPIPAFILLKEFKKISPDSLEYQDAYDRVHSHPFVRAMEDEQNERGFWQPFHGSEDMIRRCLTLGLDREHPCLKKVTEYLVKVLNNEENWDESEKQDNVRWWPEMFVPLVCAAMLSLTDPGNEILDLHRRRWANFAEIAFAKGYYDKEAESKAQHEYFGFITKRTIPAFGYYNLLLLAPTDRENFISDAADEALVDHCMNCADNIYYVYNCGLSDFVPIGTKRRDSRDFCHWVRALALVSQFRGWKKYRERYVEWILSQRNEDGLWELPRKPDRYDFPLSDSWRSRKNRVIDSSIMILRFLSNSKAL
ncbi:MAG TPA: hypothetical protein PK127_03720 [Clostridiales bacterium]|nr:hypothetical protein [Clostridiales bacterium]